ncbi:SDR family oxidoreductase [Oceanobacillus sp. CAU 1775]
MKVLLVGANGQIGRHIVKFAKEDSSINVTAMVRKEEQAAAFNEEGTETVLADLEGSVADLTKSMEGMDAVIFTAGSGGHTGADKTILIDLDGAAKTVEAAEAANVDRFIMISAFQANNREVWADSPIKYYMAAKHYADNILMNSKLNYTIIRPGGLVNDAGTGKVEAGELQEYGSISREDVAKTVVESLSNEKTHRKGFDIIAGEHDIKTALNKL